MSTAAAAAAAAEALPAVATPVAKLKRKRANTALPGEIEQHLGNHGATTQTEEVVVSPDLAQLHPNARYARQLVNSQQEGEDDDVEEDDVDVDGEEEIHDVSNGEASSSDGQTSIFEDMLELIEEGDYVAERDTNLRIPPQTVAQLRVDLKNNGPEAFLQENLKYDTFTGKYEPRLLGAVFGIDPDFPMDDEVHLRLLWLAVRHAFSKRSKLAQYNTIDDAAHLLRRSDKIIVITGAGISTSLGIPDFRSRHTGFYEKLREAGYTDPEEVFSINEFDADPNKFYGLAGDLLPDFKVFSPTHAFVRLLQDQGRLRTNYTQNIDNLEELAGIEKDRLIQCHGSFATATCRKCQHQVAGAEIFADMRAKRVARCKNCLKHLQVRAPPPAKRRNVKSHRKRQDWEDSDSDNDGSYDIPEAGVMKPDITFFGERLPDTFFDCFTERDQHHADLVLVIGTSLKVAPVSEIPNYLPPHVPHIYISREPIRHVNFDIQLLGDCDKVVAELCRRAGWELKHDMLPANHRLTVKPEGDDEYIWRIAPVVAASPLLAPKSLTNSGRSSPNARMGSPARSTASARRLGHLTPDTRMHSPARSPARSAR